ncbi:MAG: hypothetical protein PHC64_02620 [Candidatus Gastranaerophilales bacterium]|nr:hypothetical protein [Candidatus Gastranaerophilales bacterium]
MKNQKFDDYIISRLSSDKEFATEYLNSALEEYSKDLDSDALALSIKKLIKAQGSVIDFSKLANINREHLYRIFNSKAVPNLNTLFKIIINLGFKLEAKPVLNTKKYC